MKYKLICCEVFLREACFVIARSKNTVDPEFTPKAAHENSESLRKILQEKIDSVLPEHNYDAILLGFGLCGNSTSGIISRSVPLVIPRAHDCCTIFLGCRKKFMEYFKDNLSAEWSSTGYMERGEGYLRETETGKLLGTDKSYEELVIQYGEENAQYIWETLHPEKKNDELYYIEMPETAHLGYVDKMKEHASKENKKLNIMQGDIRLIEGLINGNWNEEEYLIVPPGHIIEPVYDHEKIVKISKHRKDDL